MFKNVFLSIPVFVNKPTGAILDLFLQCLLIIEKKTKFWKNVLTIIFLSMFVSLQVAQDLGTYFSLFLFKLYFFFTVFI